MNEHGPHRTACDQNMDQNQGKRHAGIDNVDQNTGIRPLDYASVWNLCNVDEQRMLVVDFCARANQPFGASIGLMHACDGVIKSSSPAKRSPADMPPPSADMILEIYPLNTLRGHNFLPLSTHDSRGWNVQTKSMRVKPRNRVPRKLNLLCAKPQNHNHHPQKTKTGTTSTSNPIKTSNISGNGCCQ